jgi:hypothetical protein
MVDVPFGRKAVSCDSRVPKADPVVFLSVRLPVQGDQAALQQSLLISVLGKRQEYGLNIFQGVICIAVRLSAEADPFPAQDQIKGEAAPCQDRSELFLLLRQIESKPFLKSAGMGRGSPGRVFSGCLADDLIMGLPLFR